MEKFQLILKNRLKTSLKILKNICIFTALLLLQIQISHAAGIKINEIHPNPEGKDTGKEWIELYNTKQSPITLENYSIQTTKKTHKIPKTTIPAKSHTIIPIPLLNKEDTLSLINENNSTEHKVSYPKSQEGKSYSHVTISNQQGVRTTTWLWTAPTRKLKNPIFQELNGRISTPPQIASNYFFEIETASKEIKKIFFKEADFKFTTLQNILKENTKVILLTNSNKDQSFLQKYKINALTPQEQISAQQTQQTNQTHQKQQPAKSKTKLKTKGADSHHNYLLLPIIILTIALVWSHKSSAQNPPSSSHD